MRATRREEISNYLIYIKKEKEIFTMRKVKRIKNVLCVLLGLSEDIPIHEEKYELHKLLGALLSQIYL